MTATFEDRLKYAAANLRDTSEWSLGELGDCDSMHDETIDHLSDAVVAMVNLVRSLPSPNTYSDGRMIRSTAMITDGLVTSRLWLPEVAEDEVRSWRGHLPRYDEHSPSAGMYEVTTDPATQAIHIRILGGAA